MKFTPISNVAFPARSEIEDVRQRLEDWRLNRKQRGPIPEELWVSAAKLARAYGPGKIAQALRLDYYGLKRRLNSAKQSVISTRQTKPTFVDLTPCMPAPMCECTMELEHPCGAKMRVQIRGTSGPDLVALSTAFWNKE